jgi:Rrf2 family protein
MRLSNKSEYACLALIDLTEHYKEGLCTVADIAERKEIPRKFLEQILLMLRNGGYVRSHKGVRGGYELAKDPAAINVAEVIRLMDGALAPVESVSKYFYESTPLEKAPKLLSVFQIIRDYIATKLEDTYFADLVE